jgi:hypothetical protein
MFKRQPHPLQNLRDVRPLPNIQFWSFDLHDFS